MESVRGACRNHDEAAERVTRRVGGIRPRTGYPATRAWTGVRTIFPFSLGAGDAGFGARAGDCETGGAQTRRCAPHRGHRAGRPTPGDVVLYVAAWTADTGISLPNIRG